MEMLEKNEQMQEEFSPSKAAYRQGIAEVPHHQATQSLQELLIL
jgi:hypothetical protein